MRLPRTWVPGLCSSASPSPGPSAASWATRRSGETSSPISRSEAAATVSLASCVLQGGHTLASLVTRRLNTLLAAAMARLPAAATQVLVFPSDFRDQTLLSAELGPGDTAG